MKVNYPMYKYTTKKVRPLFSSRCGKLSYPDKKSAITLINSKDGFSRNGRKLRAYPCPTCHPYWHITKN